LISLFGQDPGFSPQGDVAKILDLVRKAMWPRSWIYSTGLGFSPQSHNIHTAFKTSMHVQIRRIVCSLPTQSKAKVVTEWPGV
jgi:hypothetical protein